MSDFTNRIDKLLTENNLKRVDLCRATGINESTIRNWIRTDSMPSVDKAILIAEFFNVTVEMLVYGFDTNSSEGNKMPYRLNLSEMDVMDTYRKLKPQDKLEALNFMEYKLSKYDECSQLDKKND